MKIRKLILLLFAFHLSCQSFNKDSKNSTIEFETAASKPSLFGENVISTPLYERDMAISAHGNELIYTLGDYKQKKRCLVIMHKVNGAWEKPEIMKISGEYQDIEPFYSPNEDRLYFVSNRPIYEDAERDDYNIWYSNKIDAIWQEPVPLDSIINNKGDEFYPSISKYGNLFFTATSENGFGKEDIYQSRFENGKFLNPEPLPAEINSSSYEFNAFISPDENYIIFSSFGREDGRGGGDLYFSVKDENGNWKEAQNMGKFVNSEASDYCPFVDFNSEIFYFTSERTLNEHVKIESVNDLKVHANNVYNGFGNIYKMRLNEIGLFNK